MASDQSRIRRAAAVVLGLAVLCAGPAAAEETPLTAESRTALSLTVYNQDLALVSETRQIGLPAGETLLAIEDVSDRLQPQSVLLDAPGVRLVEQSFAADLLTPQRLLEASLGKTVRLIRTHPQTGKDTVVEAEVLSLAGGIVLRIGEQIETVPPGRIAFAEVPPGLRSAPALLARLAVDEAGEQRVKLDYLTSGLSWQADYVARLNETEDRLDLTALVTLTNTTRSDFEDAVLRLVAGEVNRVSPPVVPQLEQQRMMVAAPAMAADLAGPPQGASDRYVYQVTRPVTLLRGETKQIPLMSAAAVAVRREYRFDALVSGNPGVEEIGPLSARLDLELENGTDAGLGTPLPAGVVRIYGPGPGEQPLFL
uniref:DUF4139 domain-containing protein n=1 Tax=Pelagibius sp. TaxID=1931238 RepID=UPI00262B5D94